MLEESTQSQEKNKLPYLGYGIAGIGTGLMVQAPGILLLIYMTDTLAIPAALAGLAMFAPRLFDVISDPIMGLISDRTKSRWGRRRPYLLLGAIITGLSACFLFNTPEFESVNLRLLFVMSFYILMIAGATVFMIPHIAMSAEMTDDYHQRTKLMSVRTFFAMGGVLAAGVLAPIAVMKAGGGRDGYAMMSIGLGIIIGGAFLATFIGTRKVRFSSTNEKSVPIVEQIKIVSGNQQFKIFMFSFVLYTTAMGCMTSVVPYFASYILLRPDFVPNIFGTAQILGMLSIPFWIFVAKRFQKHNCYKVGLGLIAIACACNFFVHAQLPMPFVYMAFAIFGLGFTATQVSTWSMLPDIIQWDEIKYRTLRGGIFAGAMIAIEKIGFALGSLLGGLMLGWTGYIESSGGDVSQPASAILGIKMVISVIPAIFVIIAVIIIMKYSLSEQVLKDSASGPNEAS